MGRACSERSRGAQDGAGDGDHPPAPLREADVPVRGRRAAARIGGPQLLGGGTDKVLDAAGGRGGSGESGDGAFPGGQDRGGRGGQRRPGGTDSASAAPQPDKLSDGATSQTLVPAGSFERSDALYERLVGFLADDESAAVTHGELEARLGTDTHCPTAEYEARLMLQIAGS